MRGALHSLFVTSRANVLILSVEPLAASIQPARAKPFRNRHLLLVIDRTMSATVVALAHAASSNAV